MKVYELPLEIPASATLSHVEVLIEGDPVARFPLRGDEESVKIAVKMTPADAARAMATLVWEEA